MDGTITVSTGSAEEGEVNRTCWGVKRPVLLQRRVQLKQQPAHLYICKNGNPLSPSTNVAEFTLKYNEEHLLMTNQLPTIQHVFLDEEAVVKIDTDKPPVHQAFLVRVMHKQTVVTVGPNTPLAWLLNMDCLHVNQIMLTGDQMYNMFVKEEEKL